MLTLPTSLPAAYDVPTEDLLRFTQLDDDCKADIRAKLRAMWAMDNARKQGLRVGDVAASLASKLGLTAKTLQNLRTAFAAGGQDWRTLWDKRRWHDSEEANLPEAFLEYWRALCLCNQRKSAPAYRELLRRWNAWRRGDETMAMPGYDECPPEEGNFGHPGGWSNRNLNRFLPTRVERAGARLGRTLAGQYTPPVFTSRVGLLVGQYYLFDDMWHDHKLDVPGQRAARRPVEFHAMDLFSGNKFAWGIKAMLEDLETGKMKHLSEREMRFLVVAVLAGTGYLPLHLGGTTLVVENATASIPAWLEEMLHHFTEGAVKVDRAGMSGAGAFAGQYGGRAKGNFKFKAALESCGNLYHNEMGFLRGQVGMNSRGKGFDGPVEELHGREREYDALVKAMAALPPERAALIRLPLLDLDTFREVAGMIYRRINERTDHDLEGWVEAGLTLMEYRLSLDTPWVEATKFLSLDDARREVAFALVEADHRLRRRRQRSPAEVFAAGAGQLIKLPPHLAAMALGRDLAVERRVSRHNLFEFEDQDAGPGQWRFEAAVMAGARREWLKSGEKFLTILNPCAPDVLHVLNAGGGYVGTCERVDSVSRADVESLQAAMGRAEKAKNELLYPVAARGADITRRKIADAKHNADVLGGKPVTEDEKARQREIAANVRGVTAEDTEALLNRGERSGHGDEAEAVPFDDAESLL